MDCNSLQPYHIAKREGFLWPCVTCSPAVRDGLRALIANFLYFRGNSSTLAPMGFLVSLKYPPTTAPTLPTLQSSPGLTHVSTPRVPVQKCCRAGTKPARTTPACLKTRRTCCFYNCAKFVRLLKSRGDVKEIRTA